MPGVAVEMDAGGGGGAPRVLPKGQRGAGADGSGAAARGGGRAPWFTEWEAAERRRVGTRRGPMRGSCGAARDFGSELLGI